MRRRKTKVIAKRRQRRRRKALNRGVHPNSFQSTVIDLINEKKEAFAAAKELLSQNDDKVLRYVAIELRRCLEAVVYEKLWAYRNWIPAKVARTWQPPQAFKALLIVEPDAEKSKTIAIGPGGEPGNLQLGPFTVLGDDVRPKSAWLNKTWNKLGHFLHATWPFAPPSKKQNNDGGRAFFEEVLSSLEPFVLNNFTSAGANTTDFACLLCGALVKVSQRSLDITGKATCLACNAEFVAQKEGDNFIFNVDGPPWVCECKQEMFLPSSNLKLGYQFSCKNCSSRFELAEQIWGVRKIDEASLLSAQQTEV